MKTPEEVAHEIVSLFADDFGHHGPTGDRRWNQVLGILYPTLIEERAAIHQERQRADDLQRTFDLRWAADMRAIKRWQAETGKDMTWPDRADMVVWMLRHLDALDTCISTLKTLRENYRNDSEHARLIDAALKAAEGE